MVESSVANMAGKKVGTKEVICVYESLLEILGHPAHALQRQG